MLIVKDIILTILPTLSSVLVLIIANAYSRRNMEKQINSSSMQASQQRDFEREKIQNERKYSNKTEIIANVLSIKSECNFTQNYDMELSETQKKYENIIKTANLVITKLYLSFPELTDCGYAILSKCDEIWGNEKNYVSQQNSKCALNSNSKSNEDLQILCRQLNENCLFLLEKLKT